MGKVRRSSSTASELEYRVGTRVGASALTPPDDREPGEAAGAFRREPPAPGLDLLGDPSALPVEKPVRQCRPLDSDPSSAKPRCEFGHGERCASAGCNPLRCPLSAVERFPGLSGHAHVFAPESASAAPILHPNVREQDGMVEPFPSSETAWLSHSRHVPPTRANRRQPP